MELQKIIKDISNERFEPYLLRCNGDQKKAFELYEYNIKVSQSFYAPLSALEVTLRNKIDESFKEHFGDDFWLRNVLPPVMGKQVTDLEQKLVQRKKTITNSSILAELNFGFWTILFNRRFAKTYWKPLHRIFEHIPKHQRKRSEISAKLNHIRTFRNRIYHYEPIIWDSEVLDQKHNDILDVLYWLNPETVEWVRSIDTYEDIKSRVRMNEL
ncbi:MAG: hypothetical protein JJT77_12545 [Crocinitomicaceae bacterium]|nr:hypothetical protein [Crocinitomicaceae bacterium]